MPLVRQFIGRYCCVSSGDTSTCDNSPGAKRLSGMNRNSAPFLLALSLAGISAAVFATKWGVDNASDASVYLGAAASLLKGRGLVIPFGQAEPMAMTHYPPLFPIVLAAAGFFGGDVQASARWLQALLMGANVFLIGWIIRKCAASFWIPLFGAFLVLASESVLRLHVAALSEPLFLFLSFLGLFLLARYFLDEKLPYLIAASVAVGLAVLCRYVGAALVAAGAVSLMFIGGGPMSRKLRDSAILIVITALPMMLWFLRNRLVAGSGTDRAMHFHPPGLTHMTIGLKTVSSWILPQSLSGVAGGVVFLVVLAILFWMAFGGRGRREQDEVGGNGRLSAAVSRLQCVFILMYVALLLVSMTFFDAYTYLNNRMLAPVFVSVVILACCQANMFLERSRRKRAWRAALVALFVIVAGMYLYRTTILIRSARFEGMGYNSAGWRHSELIREVSTLPPEIPVYTNAPDAVYMLTGRSSLWVPAVYDPVTRQVNAGYMDEVIEMGKNLEKSEGMVVYFDAVTWRGHLVKEGALKALLPLKPAKSLPEGSMYHMSR